MCEQTKKLQIAKLVESLHIGYTYCRNCLKIERYTRCRIAEINNKTEYICEECTPIFYPKYFDKDGNWIYGNKPNNNKS